MCLTKINTQEIQEDTHTFSLQFIAYSVGLTPGRPIGWDSSNGQKL